MTNEEWLNALSVEKKAEWIEWLDDTTTCEVCAYHIDEEQCCKPLQLCKEGIIEWLNAEHKEPMPKLDVGDCIIFREGSNRYRAICIHENVVYCVVRDRCYIFDDPLKEDTVAIQRYSTKTGSFEDIWRTD